MSLWDQLKFFLAEDAAKLIAPTETERLAVLRRMQESYDVGLREVSQKHFDLTHAEDREKHTARYQVFDQPLPKNALFSRFLLMQSDRLFRPAVEQSACQYFDEWMKTKVGENDVDCCAFSVQKFSREEIGRWLHLQGIESEYAFLPEQAAQENTEGTANSPCTVWVTQEKLLAAFEDWGLKAAWFRALNGHQWLLNARRQEGVGGRGGRQALFCPYAVMVGLTKDIKARSKDKKLPFNEGVRILRSRFPKAADEHIPDYMQD